MIRTSFLANCPRCGSVAEAWTKDGIIIQIRCSLCGYEGEKPASPDLKERPWRI